MLQFNIVDILHFTDVEWRALKTQLTISNNSSAYLAECLMTDGLSDDLRQNQELETQERRNAALRQKKIDDGLIKKVSEPSPWILVHFIDPRLRPHNISYRRHSGHYNPSKTTVKGVYPLKVLLDSGSSGNLISDEFLLQPHQLLAHHKPYDKDETKWQTGAGVFHTHHKTELAFKLPEFSNSRECKAEFKLSSKLCSYGAIIGRGLMTSLGININFQTKCIEWDGVSIDMPTNAVWSDRLQEQQFTTQSVPSSILAHEARVGDILRASYEKATLSECLPSHLSPTQNKEGLLLLTSFEDLFQGKLGKIRGVEDVKIELKPNSSPISKRHFNIPHILFQPTKEEIKRFCDIGVMFPQNNSPWGFPSFIVRKKNGEIRIVTDLRALNRICVLKPWPVYS